MKTNQKWNPGTLVGVSNDECVGYVYYDIFGLVTG